jgi:hypothetical protein
LTEGRVGKGSHKDKSYLFQRVAVKQERILIDIVGKGLRRDAEGPFVGQMICGLAIGYPFLKKKGEKFVVIGKINYFCARNMHFL